MCITIFTIVLELHLNHSLTGTREVRGSMSNCIRCGGKGFYEKHEGYGNTVAVPCDCFETMDIFEIRKCNNCGRFLAVPNGFINKTIVCDKCKEEEILNRK